MRLHHSVITLTLAVLCIPFAASAYEPVPGPAFSGCRLLNYGSQPYAPLPRFNIMVYGGAVDNWPVGAYDFCAHLDTVYCSLPVVRRYFGDPRITHLADLILCRTCDINGPLVYPDPEGEAEEGELVVPVTPNGILDGQYELAILAGILNDTSHPLHAEATNVFQNNFRIIKDSLLMEFSDYNGNDVRTQMRAYAPHLCGAMAATYAAYLTMDDPMTNDAIEEMYIIFDWLISEPLNWVGIKTCPATGPDGDANGDGFSNRAAYHWYVDILGFDRSAFVAAAINPAATLELLAISGGGVYYTNDTIRLEARLTQANPAGPVAWYRNGLLLTGENGVVLLDTADEADTPIRYDAQVLAAPTFVAHPPQLVNASTVVRVLPESEREGEGHYEGEGESEEEGEPAEGEDEIEGEGEYEGEYEGESEGEDEGEDEGEGEGEGEPDERKCGCAKGRTKTLTDWLSDWLLVGFAGIALLAFREKKSI